MEKFFFQPSSRWCVGSHLVGSFLSQASNEAHMVVLLTWILRILNMLTYPLYKISPFSALPSDANFSDGTEDIQILPIYCNDLEKLKYLKNGQLDIPVISIVYSLFRALYIFEIQTMFLCFGGISCALIFGWRQYQIDIRRFRTFRLRKQKRNNRIRVVNQKTCKTNIYIYVKQQIQYNLQIVLN